jgi:hypothetical protein
MWRIVAPKKLVAAKIWRSAACSHHRGIFGVVGSTDTSPTQPSSCAYLIQFRRINDPFTAARGWVQSNSTLGCQALKMTLTMPQMPFCLQVLKINLGFS